MTLERCKTRWVAWLAAATITLLLIANTAQAVHMCGLTAAGSGEVLQSQISSNASNGALCMTCLMAQCAAVALFFVVFSPARHRSIVVRPPKVWPRSFLDSFHLYVRPPPAC